MFRRMKQNVAEKMGRATVTSVLPADVEKDIRYTREWKQRHAEVTKAYESLTNTKEPNKRDDTANHFAKAAQLLPNATAACNGGADVERGASKQEGKATALVRKDWAPQMHEWEKKKIGALIEVGTQLNKSRLDKDACAGALQNKETPSRRERADEAEAAFEAKLAEAKEAFSKIHEMEKEIADLFKETMTKHGEMHGA